MDASALTTNPRGIPKAPFIDNVDQFVGAPDNVEATLRKFQEMIAKYKTMETHLTQRRRGLESKIPEIKKTLDMVHFIMARANANEQIITEFEISDTLWVNAKIENTKAVCLWLGANVMLEYETDEARDLLTEKLDTARLSLDQVKEDLTFLKEQITTMEVTAYFFFFPSFVKGSPIREKVNFSRVHNWDVKMRRESGTSK